MAGLYGIQFGLLPLAENDLQEAVRWAWRHFRELPEAGVLDPATQIVPNIQRWIAEKWNVTVKSVGAGNSSLTSAAALPGLNNREAVAWYDDTTIYIPSGRLVEAAGMFFAVGNRDRGGISTEMVLWRGEAANSASPFAVYRISVSLILTRCDGPSFIRVGTQAVARGRRWRMIHRDRLSCWTG